MFKFVRNLLIILSLFLFLPLLGACKKGEKVEGTKAVGQTEVSCPSGMEVVEVKRAVDGDTVELKTGEKLRYAAINTLELHTETGVPEPFAKEAYLRNKELVEGKKLCLAKNIREKDRFGRLLGELYFPNGTSVSEILVKEGLALCCWFEGSGNLFEKCLPIQRSAIKARVGLFSLLDKAGPGPYYGNKNSKRFHHPACSKDVNIKRMVVFKTAEEALLEGYCPVRTCTEYVFGKAEN